MSNKPALNVTDGGEAVHRLEKSFTAAEKIKILLYSLVNKYIKYCTLYNKAYPERLLPIFNEGGDKRSYHTYSSIDPFGVSYIFLSIPLTTTTTFRKTAPTT
jgi:hypothetical protein